MTRRIIDLSEADEKVKQDALRYLCSAKAWLAAAESAANDNFNPGLNIALANVSFGLSGAKSALEKIGGAK